jgi:hypothetical protein
MLCAEIGRLSLASQNGRWLPHDRSILLSHQAKHFEFVHECFDVLSIIRLEVSYDRRDVPLRGEKLKAFREALARAAV